MLAAIGICALLAAGAADAVSIEVAVPGLVGAYERPGESRATHFDVGMHFSEIESILLRFDIGDGDRGGLCTTSIPAYCTVGSILDFALVGPSGERVRGGFSGLGPYARNWGQIEREVRWIGLESFELDPWPAFLLDGRGEIILSLAGFGEAGVLGSGFHRAEVLGATLIITGTPVPSPSTAASVLLGLVMLQAGAASRRRTAG